MSGRKSRAELLLKDAAIQARREAEREVLEAALRYAKACDDTKKPGADAVEVGLAWEFEHGAFILSVRRYRVLLDEKAEGKKA